MSKTKIGKVKVKLTHTTFCQHFEGKKSQHFEEKQDFYHPLEIVEERLFF